MVHGMKDWASPVGKLHKHECTYERTDTGGDSKSRDLLQGKSFLYDAHLLVHRDTHKGCAVANHYEWGRRHGVCRRQRMYNTATRSVLCIDLQMIDTKPVNL